jgi:hypothetical protein
MSRSLPSPLDPPRFRRIDSRHVAVGLILLATVLAWGYASRHRASRPPYGIPDRALAQFHGEGAAAAVSTADAPAPAPMAMQTPTAKAMFAPRVPVDADAAAERETGRDALPTATTLSAMIIRSGTASVRVDSLDVAVARVRALASRDGGFIANSSQETGSDAVRSSTLEIRVPAANFDALLAGLTPLGAVETVNITAEDVGEEYVDVEARVANAHRLEGRLVDLLATRTGKLTDVLDVERELARVRETIERYEGRLRYLRARSAMSTLSLTVHEPAPVLQRPGIHPIADAVGEAWRNAVGVVATGIAAAGVLVPLAIVAGLAWALARRLRRGRGAPVAPA